MFMREYRPEDLTAVVNIANAAWKHIFEVRRELLGDKISDVIFPNGEGEVKGNGIKRKLETGSCEILICENDAQVVGFITYTVKGNIAEIGDNAALPGCKLKGIGQCMYNEVIRRVKAAGAKILTVETGLDEAHSPARRAYERAGFNRSFECIYYFMDLDEI